MNYLPIRYFKKDNNNLHILIYRIEKMEKIKFIVAYWYLDASSSKSKVGDKKTEELGDWLPLKYFFASFPPNGFYYL